jgi:hypothetical protein
MGKNEMAGHVARRGDGGIYRVLAKKREVKKPRGRTRRRWEHDIQMDLKRWYVEAWIGSSWLMIRTGGGPSRMR